jgi:hypothetical protein
MTWTKRNWFYLLLVLAVFAAPWVISLRAQTAAPWQVTVTGLHTACVVSPVTVPASATLCVAGDGTWMSVNGGAYTQLGASTTSGVISVNGKTGVVVLAGTTTSTTTIQ